MRFLPRPKPGVSTQGVPDEATGGGLAVVAGSIRDDGGRQVEVQALRQALEAARSENLELRRRLGLCLWLSVAGAGPRAISLAPFAARYRRRMHTPPKQVPAVLDGPGVKVSDPHELLRGYLDWYRQALTRKIAGLSDDQLRTPIEPLGWSALGMVKHLGWVERRWMRWGFAAENVPAHPPGGDEIEWSVAAEETTDSVMAAYLDEVRQSQILAADAALTDSADLGGRFETTEQAPSLGRILFHLLQEYARHLGQLDVARELIDGETGE
jgi:uncharacterized damage-inducible protein DinB